MQLDYYLEPVQLKGESKGALVGSLDFLFSILFKYHPVPRAKDNSFAGLIWPTGLEFDTYALEQDKPLEQQLV